MSDPRLNLPSASSIERLMLCPASHRLSMGMQDEGGDDADFGTFVHSLIAWEDVDLDYPRYHEADAIASELSLKKEEVSNAWLAEDQMRDYIEREKRLWLHDGLTPIFSGQLDHLEVIGTRGLVIDYKAIQWGDHTETSRNPQLMAQAVLAANEYDLDEVTVCLIQSGHKPEPVVYVKDDLTKAESLLRETLRQAMDEALPPRPGEKQCQYCKAKAICPAATGEMKALAFEEVVEINRWEVMPAAEKLALYDSAQVAKKVIAEIESRIKADLAANPEAIPGLKEKPGSIRRNVSDAQEAYSRLADVVSVEEFVPACQVAIGKLETAYYQKRKSADKKVTEAKAKAEMEGRLAGLIEEKQTAPSIARA